MVEYNTLLTQAQQFLYQYQSGLIQQDSSNASILMQLQSEGRIYVRNLFKKKRQAADHIVVWMLSDEKRDRKPNTLPVGCVPCGVLRDQYVRDM